MRIACDDCAVTTVRETLTRAIRIDSNDTGSTVDLSVTPLP